MLTNDRISHKQQQGSDICDSLQYSRGTNTESIQWNPIIWTLYPLLPLVLVQFIGCCKSSSSTLKRARTLFTGHGSLQP